MLKQNIINLQKRLESFKNWRSETEYVALACAGFRYTGREDRVECEECGIRIIKWTTGDDPLQCHYRLGPTCKFLQEIGLTPNHKLAKYNKYSQYESRIKSMESIPDDYALSIPPTESLARSGLFYFGTIDRMCCYHCGLIMRDWDETTDPIEVHQQYKPDCFFIETYVNQKNGQDSTVTRTLQLVENHLGMKQTTESFTYKLAEEIRQHSTSRNNVNDEVKNTSKEEDDKPCVKQFKLPKTKSDKSDKCSTIRNHPQDAAPCSKFKDQIVCDGISTDDNVEIEDEDLFDEAPKSKAGYISDSSKPPKMKMFKNIPYTKQRNSKSKTPMSLQLPKDSASISSKSSGYSSFSSLSSELDCRSPLIPGPSRQLEVADSHNSNKSSPNTKKLPPIYNNCDFSKLPMVLAVLDMGFSYDQIVSVVCKSYHQHRYVFDSAEALLDALLNESE